MDVLGPIVVASQTGGGQVGVVDPRNGSYAWYRLPGAFFVTADVVRSLVYATSSSHGGSVHTLRLEPNRSLSLVHVLRNVGEFPCHLALTPDGSLLAVADYEAGRVVVTDLAEGIPVGVPRGTTLPMPNREPLNDRQTRPYPHFCLFDSPSRLLVTSLGGDRLWALDPGTTQIISSVACPAGAGPRHIVRDVAGALWCTGELDSSVIRFDAQMRVTHAHSLLPDNWHGENYPSDIVSVGGRWIVAANRGADTLVVFDALAPNLGRIADVPCGGRWPAHLFPIGETQLLVANTHTDSVRLFTLNDHGVPIPDPRELRVPRPTALCATDPDARTRLGA